jgi:AbrB family looped-hinge helix DNA binding protein
MLDTDCISYHSWQVGINNIGGIDMLAVKVLPKGQITLPKEMRQKLHIEVGDTLLMDADGEQFFFRKGKTIFDFKGVLPSMGMTIDEIREKGIAGGVSADE